MELCGTLHGIVWYTAWNCVVHCMELCGTLHGIVRREGSENKRKWKWQNVN
jgi:hypothetical protein